MIVALKALAARFANRWRWHERRPRPKPEPYHGACKLAANSSFKKLARAMRQGKVPPERQAIIDLAVKNAQRRVQS